MRLDSGQTQGLFLTGRVARLGTVSPTGEPHLVPVVFAFAANTIYTAIDWKPKTTRNLRRLTNIAANPHVSLLVDHYSDDWTHLWWARADGLARIAESAETESALDLLADRYAQYVTQRPPGPVIAVDVTAWTGWSAS